MLPDVRALTELLTAVGRELLAWRDDASARAVHEPAAFKTEADRRAHEMLERGLATLYPGVGVCSEESSTAQQQRARERGEYWIIDPIDGTASWFGGFSGFVTQVALIRAHVPELGLVHAPSLAKTWCAQRGQGARLNGQPLAAQPVRTPPIFIDNTPRPHGITARLMTALRSQSYRESGSLGLKSVLVGDGSADLFVKDVVVRDWDLAPAAALIGELGGAIVRLDGSRYSFSGAIEKPGGFLVARRPEYLELALNALQSLTESQEAS
jgi:3'(2'), 5'-bisphosphate nucleotidase